MTNIISQAAVRALALGAPLNTNAVIAVLDREGWVLGVWAYNPNIAISDPDQLVALAIAKATSAVRCSSRSQSTAYRFSPMAQ